MTLFNLSSIMPDLGRYNWSELSVDDTLWLLIGADSVSAEAYRGKIGRYILIVCKDVVYAYDPRTSICTTIKDTANVEELFNAIVSLKELDGFLYDADITDRTCYTIFNTMEPDNCAPITDIKPCNCLPDAEGYVVVKSFSAYTVVACIDGSNITKLFIHNTQAKWFIEVRDNSTFNAFVNKIKTFYGKEISTGDDLVILRNFIKAWCPEKLDTLNLIVQSYPDKSLLEISKCLCDGGVKNDV